MSSEMYISYRRILPSHQLRLLENFHELKLAHPDRLKLEPKWCYIACCTIVSMVKWRLLKRSVKPPIFAPAVLFPSGRSETDVLDPRRPKNLEKRKVRKHRFSINIP